MKNPTVSVVIAVHNGERYLRHALDSILAQTFQDFEVILVDDASHDATLSIMQEYRDGRTKIIENPHNLGLTKSLNVGLSQVMGEFIARQDDDDLSAPDRLEKQVAFLKEHPDYAGVGSFVKVLGENLEYQYRIKKPVTDESIRNFLKFDNCITHGSVMLRTNCVRDIGGYDEEIARAQDYDLFVRLSEQYRLANLPEYLCTRISHPSNITSQYAEEQRRYVRRIKQKASERATPLIDRSISSDSEQPLFSVLMANYNNSRYIAEAIESVIDQTFPAWELLIVDDCSNDDSVKVVQQYLGDARIRLLKNKKNCGYILTLKRLINNARAEVVGTLDSDDALTTDALAKMYDAHKRHPEWGFVYSQFMYCNQKLGPVRLGFCKAPGPDKSNLHEDCVSHFRTFKIDVYKKCGGFDDKMLYSEDKDLIYKMEEVTEIGFVDKPLYAYRVLEESQAHGRKRARGLVSHTLAKYAAYKRRRGSNVANLSAEEMSTALFLGARQALGGRHMGYAVYFFVNALALSPLNRKGIRVFMRGNSSS